MGTLQKYTFFCERTEKMIGVHATLMDMSHKYFACPSFCTETSVSGCTAFSTHLYGAYQAQSQGGQYCYICPRGLQFIALPIVQNNRLEYCLIIGPMRIEGEEPAPSDEVCHHSLEGVPAFSREHVKEMAEWLSFSVPDYKFNDKISTSLYGELSGGVFVRGYSLDTLKRLCAAIRGGNRNLAKELLEEILQTLFSILGDDYNGLRWQIIELFVRMSRAAVRAGAERERVLQFYLKHLREADRITDVQAYRNWIQSALDTLIGFVFNLDSVKYKSIVYETSKYIKHHLAEKISLEDAADNVCLSRSYFCKIISKELGYTFTELVSRIRIEQSRTYLDEKELSIAQVALAVGFEDQSYYTKCFKRYTGITPAQYRKNAV